MVCNYGDVVSIFNSPDWPVPTAGGERVSDILAKIRYKPNFSFSVPAELPGWVSVTMTVPDAVTGDERIISGRFPAPEGYSLREFLDWVFECAQRMERHEAREQFWYDGEVFDSPHAGGRTEL